MFNDEIIQEKKRIDRQIKLFNQKILVLLELVLVVEKAKY